MQYVTLCDQFFSIINLMYSHLSVVFLTLNATSNFASSLEDPVLCQKLHEHINTLGNAHSQQGIQLCVVTPPVWVTKPKRTSRTNLKESDAKSLIIMLITRYFCFACRNFVFLMSLSFPQPCPSPRVTLEQTVHTSPGLQLGWWCRKAPIPSLHSNTNTSGLT